MSGFDPALDEERIALPNGRAFRLRPVRPSDAPAFQAEFARLHPEDIRMRFFAPMGRLTTEMAERLTRVDHAHETALVAIAPEEDGEDRLFGVVRLVADEEFRSAEFAIIIDSGLKGQGLGRVLMQHIVEHARRMGLGEIWGYVLRENRRMLSLARELGFRREAYAQDAAVVRVTLLL